MIYNPKWDQFGWTLSTMGQVIFWLILHTRPTEIEVEFTEEIDMTFDFEGESDA